MKKGKRGNDVIILRRIILKTKVLAIVRAFD